MCNYFDLDQNSRDILEFTWTIQNNHNLNIVIENFVRAKKERVPIALARMFGRPESHSMVAKALDMRSPLLNYGILVEDENPDHTDIFFNIDPLLLNELAVPDLSEENIVSRLLGQPTSSDLDIADFEMAEEIGIILNIIKSALKQDQHKGINFLLYGQPGEGKTKLACTIAKTLGLRMYSVGENMDNHPDPKSKTSRARKAQLLRTQALLKGSKEAILLFDEIEDLLIKGIDTDKRSDTDSKIQTNHLLEDNSVVTIWTGNDPDKFHEAVRQRFTYSIHLGNKPTLRRQDVWKLQCRLQELELSDDETLELARQYAVPSRMIAKAVRTAKLTGGGMISIEQSLRADSKLNFGSSEALKQTKRVPKDYKVNLATCGAEPIADLIDAAKARLPFSLLVQAQRDTGSSSALRYIAEQARMNVLERSMASLIVPTPFSTPEMNISIGIRCRGGRPSVPHH